MKKIKYKEKYECPICLEIIKYKIKTGCKHIFCDICIVKNLMINDTCPICRRECDYEHITHQISLKRQKFLMKKLAQPVENINTMTNTRIQQDQQIYIYSRFIPQYISVSIRMMIFFVIEIIIIIYVVVVISRTVVNMI